MEESLIFDSKYIEAIIEEIDDNGDKRINDEML